MENKSTLNRSEVEKFDKLAKQWWDKNGPLKPLRSMNFIRVPFVVSTIDRNKPGKKRLLDIGCGGGLLSEALGERFEELGFSDDEIEIIGLDPGEDNIKVAKNHLPGNLTGKVHYICDTIENYVANHPNSEFDTVIMSEVIEHVDNPEDFLRYALSVVKSGGSVILTTPGKTIFSWLTVIVLAEYILRQVPIGTHEYEKFIHLEDSKRMLQENDCVIQDIRSSLYNPLTDSWSWNSYFKMCWYAIHAVKN